MMNLLTHPIHLVLAVLLLLSALAALWMGFYHDMMQWILAGIVFELGFWFSVFSSSKMIQSHEDNFH